MAREGRSIYRMIWNNFINSLKPRQFRGNLIGSDYLGNKYYEIPQSDSNRRTARWFVPKDGDEDKFDHALPAEWEAWLRQRRKIPPTEEEVMKNFELMKIKKSRGDTIEQKFKEHSIPPGQTHSFPKLEGYEHYPGKKSGEQV